MWVSPITKRAASPKPRPLEQAVSLALSSKSRSPPPRQCYNNLARYKEAVTLLAALEESKAGDPAFDYLYGTALIRDGQAAGGAAVIHRILSRGDSAEAVCCGALWN